MNIEGIYISKITNLLIILLTFHSTVEVTKFEELEEAHAEVRLKQLLWGSLKEWDVSVDDWLQVYLLIGVLPERNCLFGN